jgi:hypothetical protein
VITLSGKLIQEMVTVKREEKFTLTIDFYAPNFNCDELVISNPSVIFNFSDPSQFSYLDKETNQRTVVDNSDFSKFLQLLAERVMQGIKEQNALSE